MHTPSKRIVLILFAIAMILSGILAPLAQAQTLTTLFSFDGTDGGDPSAGLVQATNGNFYGTTYYGGRITDSGCFRGCGTVFQITPSGTLTTLRSFSFDVGAFPATVMIQATNGGIYGTTYRGGQGGVKIGGGTIFEIGPSDSLTTLYSFCSLTNCTDGLNPNAVLQVANGDFYGTTTEGGITSAACHGTTCGTVFKITSSGALTTLHSFQGTDGYWPESALIQANNGNIYGTTESGTVFEMTPSGTFTTLVSGISANGGGPSTLVQATDGNFYGSAGGGGAYGIGGTIFKLTPTGTLTTLYAFCSQPGCTDGESPGGLIQASDGNFYGSTAIGGANNEGTIFKITPRGILTTLYSFCSQTNCTDGSEPTGLVQATDGNFYGTTHFGGAITNAGCSSGCGTVFSLAVGLGPFVETQTSSGKAGTAVKILGTDLTGATSVTFNGTAATFTVNSTGSAITATVPPGATSGTVAVTTPSGVLSSNKPFTVRE